MSPMLTLQRADTLLMRLGGLLVRPPLGAGDALLLVPCNSVHTCFMREAIDVAFVDRHGRVLRIVVELAPWRTAACLRASAAVECRSGELARLRIGLGDLIDLGTTTRGGA